MELAHGSFFYISLNDNPDFMDMGPNTLAIEPGKRFQVQVTANLHRPTDKFRSLPMDTRLSNILFLSSIFLSLIQELPL